VSALRLLLADDDPVFTAAMADLLGAREDVDLVGVVADGAAALEVLEDSEVDVALLDVDMPVLDGIATARRIASSRWQPDQPTTCPGFGVSLSRRGKPPMRTWAPIRVRPSRRPQ